MCESFTTGTSAQGARRFATLECECIERHTFAMPDDGRREVFAFIEGWYNPHRQHSALGQISPMRYEQQYQQQAVDD